MSMNNRIRSIDNIILKGLLGGSTLSQILQDVSDETMLELCLYSLNLRPMLSFASPDMHVRFEAVFSQLSAEADRYPAYTEINADNGFYIIAPIIKERNQLGFLILFAPADIWGANDISYISERLSKLCARLAMPDSLSSTYSDFEKLWASHQFQCKACIIKSVYMSVARQLCYLCFSAHRSESGKAQIRGKLCQNISA